MTNTRSRTATASKKRTQPQSQNHATSGADRALSYLDLNASEIEKWSAARRIEGNWLPPEWIRFEVFAYLGSRDKVHDDQRKTISKRWQKEALETSNYVARYRQQLGIDQPSSFWADCQHWSTDAAIDAAVLRAKSNCGINDEFYDEWLERWANDNSAFGARPCGVTEASLLSLFHLCRSDLAIELAAGKLENAFAEFCAMWCERKIPPWASPRSSRGDRVNPRWAAMMLFIGQRLKAELFQGELAGGALHAVLSTQQADGSWFVLTEDSARPSVFTTVAAIHALALWQPKGWKPAVARAVEWLWSRQSQDGAWRDDGFHDCYLTVLVLDAIDLAEGRFPLTFRIDREKLKSATRVRELVAKQASAGDAVPFVANRFQIDILNALEGRALIKDELAEEVCGGEGTRLYRPGGIKELMEVGKVAHKHRLGYYRPDAPPPSP
jgi:hypothetical protein